MNTKRLLKKIVKACSWFVLLFVLIQLFHFYALNNDFLLKRSIEHQIQYLEERIQNGLSDEAQTKFPEGKLFTNLLFALSLIDYSSKSDFDNHILVEQLILDCVSDQAKTNFPCQSTIRYGAFYNGWINYTLKKYIGSSLFQTSETSEVFLRLRAQFQNRILKSQSDSIQILETYDYSIWPGDNLVCIASLDDEQDSLKKAWLEKFYIHSTSGLIAHEGYGENAQEIRGSSQALIHYFLADIDPEGFNSTYEQYRNQFVDKRLGIEWVKEFAHGHRNADVDSGPIILGYGSVATIMNNKLSQQKGIEHSRRTLGMLNMIGMPVNFQGRKYFLGGYEPMYDIFFLWNAVEAFHP